MILSRAKNPLLGTNLHEQLLTMFGYVWIVDALGRKKQLADLSI